jgi:DNA-binding phage protein
MRIFDKKDVARLLRSEVKRAGGQSAWARKTGIERTYLTKVLAGQKPPSKRILYALKLRTVYVSDSKPPVTRGRACT